MKKLILLLGIFVSTSAITAFGQDEGESEEGTTTTVVLSEFELKKREILTKCKADMRPYKYTFTKPIRIDYKDYEYTKKIFIPANFKNQYKFIINSEMLLKAPEVKDAVTMKLFNGNPDIDDAAEVLLEFKSGDQNQIYETKPESYIEELYLQFIIPPLDASAPGKAKVGHVFLLSGYRIPVQTVAAGGDTGKGKSKKK